MGTEVCISQGRGGFSRTDAGDERSSDVVWASKSFATLSSTGTWRSAESSEWLPVVDNIRNSILSPAPEALKVLKQALGWERAG